MFYLFQLFIIIALLLVLAHRRYLTLPVLIPLLILVIVSAGCLYVSYNPRYIFTGGGIPKVSISEFESLKVFVLFRNVIVAVTLGFLLSAVIRTQLDKYVRGQYSVNSFENLGTLNSLQETLQKLSTGSAFFFFLFNINGILDRNEYLLVNAGSIVGAFRYLVPFAGLLNIYFLLVVRKNKLLAFFTFILCLIMEFSFASRSFGVLLAAPMLFLAISTNIKLYKALCLFFAAIVSSLGISISLSLRGLSSHGLLNYLASGNKIFENNNPFELMLGTYLVIIPVTLIGLRVPTPEGYIITSFNPAPGRLTDWYSMAPQLNINRWTPSGAVAQLANTGFLSSFLCWMAVGFMIGACSRYLKIRRFGDVNSIVLSALSFSASLQFLQYSLRPGMRFIYAMVLYSILANPPRVHYTSTK